MYDFNQIFWATFKPTQLKISIRESIILINELSLFQNIQYTYMYTYTYLFWICNSLSTILLTLENFKPVVLLCQINVDVVLFKCFKYKQNLWFRVRNLIFKSPKRYFFNASEAQVTVYCWFYLIIFPYQKCYKCTIFI